MREILREKCGLDGNELVLAAVSGGADSLALLHALHAAGVRLVCATFNHRLRPEAGDELEYVRSVAAGLGVSFVSGSADVAALAADAGLSLEEAARTERYRFLFRAARESGAQAVAAGHTADDQAETVLMHFLRGAGLAGLKGMPYRVVLPVFDAAIPLVRPLLGWWRADTEAYCRQNGLVPCTDPSNRDTAYFRNRLRHELIPQLEGYNPQVRQALAHTALALQGDDELLAEVVQAAWQVAVLEQGIGYIAFEKRALESLSPALRRNLFRRAAFTLRPGQRDVDFDALERAATLQAVDLSGGLKTLLEGQTLYLVEDEMALPSIYPQVDEAFSLSLGATQLGNGWVLACEVSAQVSWSGSRDGMLAFVDADVAGDQVNVRPVRPGDRLEPLGMPGQRVKLSDLFVNERIPKRLRKNWPMVCAGGEIIWVPGLRLAHPYRVTENTKRVLKLEIRKIE